MPCVSVKRDRVSYAISGMKPVSYSMWTRLYPLSSVAGFAAGSRQKNTLWKDSILSVHPDATFSKFLGTKLSISAYVGVKVVNGSEISSDQHRWTRDCLGILF